MIVVSEMGEQWSPQTAPAIQAEMEMIAMVPPPGKTFNTIGMRIPKVPQEVPVAKDKPTAIKKIMAGSIICNPLAEPSTSCDTKILAPKLSVIAFKVQAQVKIIMAGTMALKPSGMLSMHCLKVSTRRHKKYTTAKIMAIKEPYNKPTDASLLEKESMK